MASWVYRPSITRHNVVITRCRPLDYEREETFVTREEAIERACRVLRARIAKSENTLRTARGLLEQANAGIVLDRVER